MQLAQDIAKRLDRICGHHILVIGDVMLDRFIDGRVERISPEAPVPVLSHTNETAMPGGAANVARNLCQLGIMTSLIGIVGDDDEAGILADALSHLAGLAYHPITDASRPTTTKTRYRSGTQQILRVDNEVKHPISEAHLASVMKLVQAQMTKTDIIILSDYAKGCLTTDLIAAVIKLAKQHDKIVMIDPKSDDFSRYHGASYVTPNLSELAGAAKLTNTSLDAIGKAAKNLCQTHDISAILTTLSARGMQLSDSSDTNHHIPSIAKDVFDVSGAGDTVVSAFAAALASGAEPIEAMDFANLAASIVVSKPGTAALTAGEVIAASDLSEQSSYDLNNLTTPIAEWRKQGLRIGFTNGCFDLLHPGHLHVLREAAKLCDRLIVGVNSDQSVKALKGPSRPIQPEAIRAQSLASLPYVDAVIIFDDETPLKCVETISPDCLIKGGDYQAEEIIGASHVIENGGSVQTIALLQGHSTTAILQNS